jgi:hypothetical protein
MATYTTTGFPLPYSAPVATPIQSQRIKSRRITPQAGRALEILGHAIEYLTDEFVHREGTLSANNAQLEAVQMLMAVNRQIYYDCPEAVGLSERLRTFLHRFAD